MRLQRQLGFDVRVRIFCDGIFDKHIIIIYHTIYIYIYNIIYAYLALCYTHIIIVCIHSVDIYIILLCLKASARVNDCCEQTNFDDFTQSWPLVYSAIHCRSTAGKLIWTKTIYLYTKEDSPTVQSSSDRVHNSHTIIIIIIIIRNTMIIQ